MEGSEGGSAKGLFARTVLSAPQQIANAIKGAILNGSLGPGDRLPSGEQMASLFGVSRPTVREALRDLRAAQVLVAERGRTGGYRVAEFSLDALGSSVAEFISLSLGVQTLKPAQLFEVRQALEVLAAGVAAERRTDDDLTRLEAALPDETVIDDPKEALSADLAFHRVLAECTHNPLLVGFAGATTTAFRRFSVEIQRAAPELVVAHLESLVDAVRRGDAEGARSTMKRHLAYSAEYLGIRALLAVDEGGGGPAS